MRSLGRDCGLREEGRGNQPLEGGQKKGGGPQHAHLTYIPAVGIQRVLDEWVNLYFILCGL